MCAGSVHVGRQTTGIPTSSSLPKRIFFETASRQVKMGIFFRLGKSNLCLQVGTLYDLENGSGESHDERAPEAFLQQRRSLDSMVSCMIELRMAGAAEC
jgi:hypothetical protein